MKLITFETAKLAKEKGYGKMKTFIPKVAWYGKLYNSKGSLRFRPTYYDWNSGYSPAPYQYELMDWLREKQVFITITPHDREYAKTIDESYWDFEINIGRMDKIWGKVWEIDDKNIDLFNDNYEHCLETALQEALKLI